MNKTVRRVWTYLSETINDFMVDGALSRAAAISFYTILSIGPLLVLCIAVAGAVFGQEAARGAINDQLSGIMGTDGAALIQTMIKSASRQRGSEWATIVGVVTLLITGTSVFGELQTDLNFIWKAEPPTGSTIGALLKTRAAGLGLVGSLAFLLLVSLVISTILGAVSSYVLGLMPWAKVAFVYLNLLVTFCIVAALFAAIYKILPDRQLTWRDVGVGAVVTALLSMVGKATIAWYLAEFSVANSYGAAGTLVVVLLWIYYSSVIFLLGAEFTKVWAAHHGSREAFAAHALTTEQPVKVVRAPGRVSLRPHWLEWIAFAAIAVLSLRSVRPGRWE